MTIQNIEPAWKRRTVLLLLAVPLSVTALVLHPLKCYFIRLWEAIDAVFIDHYGWKCAWHGRRWRG